MDCFVLKEKDRCLYINIKSIAFITTGCDETGKVDKARISFLNGEAEYIYGDSVTELINVLKD